MALLHDPALAVGRRFAETGAGRGGEVRAIEGDCIRFARELLEGRSMLIAGFSRQADFILIGGDGKGAGRCSAGRVDAGPVLGWMLVNEI